MSGPTKECHICNESVPDYKLQRHIIGAHVAPINEADLGENDQPMSILELNPTMLPTVRTTSQSAASTTSADRPTNLQGLRRSDVDSGQRFFETVYIHRNVDELIQQWKERVQEATNLSEDSMVISWNGSTMLWNHKDALGEVVFIVIAPTEGQLTLKDIEHRVKHDAQETVGRVGRGDPDLEELILKYFSFAQGQLAKRLNKVRADIQAQIDEGRRYDLRERRSDEETSVLFERISNRKDQDAHQG